MWNDINKGVIHLSNKKQEQLKNVEKNNDDKAMTMNNGVKVSEDENTLTVGERGPSLLEDFHFREKIMHFDHESYMHVVLALTVNFKFTKIYLNTLLQTF